MQHPRPLFDHHLCLYLGRSPSQHPQPTPPFTPNHPPREKPSHKLSWAWARFQAWTLWDLLVDLFRHHLPAKLKVLAERLAIALLALLAPEFIFVWALRQWLRARSIAKECRKAASAERAKEGRRRSSVASIPRTINDLRAELTFLEAIRGQNWSTDGKKGGEFSSIHNLGNLTMDDSDRCDVRWD